MGQPPAQPSSARPIGPGTLPPIKIVIDANVFAHNAWIGPVVENARAGVIAPLWSPCIIAEATRLLAWQYVRRHPDGIGTKPWRDDFSDATKRWYAWVSPVFRVVEDCPPYEPQWTREPSDPWDQPIWTAAVRGNAAIVATENLKDGPPADARGRRQYRGIDYIHPEKVLRLLDAWSDMQFSKILPLLAAEDVAQQPPEVMGETRVAEPNEYPIPAAFRDAIEEIYTKLDRSD
jgi:hypothetical protein